MTALANASRFLIRPGAMPLALMLGALSSVFLFGHDRGHFYRDGNHDWITSQGLAQAVNLSLADGLLLFVDRTHDADDDLTYSTYARWPIGSYALVKLAVLPFEGNLSAAIHASRIANLLFFAAAAIAAYLAFARLVGRWVALTATLLAFSSQFALYYSDAFVPDAVPALFGLLLTFHGMVVYVQEGRFAQLLAKSCMALLMCWHAYALLLPFVVFGLMQELVRGGGAASSWAAVSRRSIAILRSSRHLRLGLATLGFGIVLLCFNLANEYMALNGKVPVLELPTLQSLGNRLGNDEFFNISWAETLAWPNYINQQLHRVAVMTLPFYASVDGSFQAFGLLLLAYGCVGLAVLRHPAMLASLLFSGVVWAFALRLHVAIHEHQGLFHIGIPLVAISFAGTLLHRSLVYGCSVLATVLFVLSSVKMAAVGHDPVQAQREGEMLKDFQAIRSIVGDDTVFIPKEQTDSFGGAPLASSYFMTGSVIEYSKFRLSLGSVDKLIRGRLDLADYTLSDRRLDVPGLITAENKHIFLYDKTCDSVCRETTLTRFSHWGENPWDTFLKDGHVIMVNEDCTNANMRFFVDYTVANPDSSDGDKQDAVSGATFKYENYRWDEYETCAVKFELPDVQIEHIRVGQRTDDSELIWSRSAFVYR